MKQLIIIVSVSLITSSLYAQKWSYAFCGKTSERAVFASNVSKAVKLAWEAEVSNKDKKESLLDDIIFGTDDEIIERYTSDNTQVGNINENLEEIAEAAGIKEVDKGPEKKKKNNSESNALIVKPLVPTVKSNDNFSEKIIESLNDAVDSDSIYALPEIIASFPGGNKALSAFISTNITLSETTQQSVSGKVFIRFMVNKEGDISKTHLVRGLSDEHNQEALRVIKQMPKWRPAQQAGITVNSWHVLPIYFGVK
jgi:hypothetical protein